MEYRNEAGELHRLDGPAVILGDGAKFWFQNNRRHRIDGPAIEYSDGARAWYQNGRCHRLDGPAFEDSDGSHAWYIYNKDVTRDVNKWLEEQNIKLPMSESEQVFFIMKFAGK